MSRGRTEVLTDFIKEHNLDIQFDTGYQSFVVYQSANLDHINVLRAFIFLAQMPTIDWDNINSNLFQVLVSKY